MTRVKEVKQFLNTVIIVIIAAVAALAVGFAAGFVCRKTIAEKHGGSISAESDNEKTAFTVVLNVLR